MFEGHAPGDAVRCPVEGCGFAGTVRQVAAHAAGVGDPDHDRLARRVERARSPDAAADRGTAEAEAGAEETPVEAFVRLFEAAHGGSAGYESGEGTGGWLFPFEEG